MSVREYVGARYVPVFADPLEWNSANTYEPLTIVLYQGNSYTSRQAVPAGIAITNTAYWAQTGNYNAQIEQYRQEVQALDTEIDNLLPVSIGNGGTGATDAAGARAAIDAAQSNGATNTLYDAELAIAEIASDIEDIQYRSPWTSVLGSSMRTIEGGGSVTQGSEFHVRNLFSDNFLEIKGDISITGFSNNPKHTVSIPASHSFVFGQQLIGGIAIIYPSTKLIEAVLINSPSTDTITISNKYFSGLSGNDSYIRFIFHGFISR